MKFFKFKIYFLFLLVFFSACRKDELVIEEQPQPPIVIEKIEVLTTGEVYDFQGEPIKNAFVTLGTSTTYTDENGLFRITGLANKTKAVLSIEHDGYFSGHPVFYPEIGIGQHIRVKLIDRLVSGTVSSSNKIINVYQHKIDFTNASFTNANGNPHNGDVIVFASYLDPTNNHLHEFMPGDLVGINLDNQERLLQSFGMLNVELEDNSGNIIKIDGEAKLTMQIPNEIIGQAPPTIPLWHFDKFTGNWIEEGEAILQGNQYEGIVTHFTLWNCDAPFELVTINGSVNTNLNPNFFSIKITRPNGNSAWTFLNEGMNFQGKVPLGEQLTLEIIDHCENILVIETIGPFTSDQDLGVFDISSSNMNTVIINGSAIDCDLMPIPNGYAMVTDGEGNNYFINFDSNGSFSDTLAWCSGNSISITAFDADAIKKSDKATFAFNTNIISENMVTCEDNVAGIYFSGPDINKFIPAISNLIETTNFEYEFQCLDNQGNGNSLLFTVTIGSVTGDPTDPQMYHSYNGLQQGTDVYSYLWGGNVSNPISEVFTTTSGGIVKLAFQNLEIQVSDPQQNDIFYPGHTVQIIGFID